MTEKEYIADRINDQIDWYSRKSQANQRWFKFLKLVELISAAIIPFLAGIGEKIPYHSVIIGSLGVIIALSIGLSSLYKYHENWISYRTISEILKHEKYLYLTQCSPYNQEDALCQLVQRVEGLISKENTQWSMYAEKSKIHNKERSDG